MAAAVGILGGTFDPVHNAHLAIARLALDHAGVEEILWIPTGAPGYRQAPIAPGADRLAMLKLAIAGEPRYRIDERELRPDASGYTHDTVAALAQYMQSFHPSYIGLTGSPEAIAKAAKAYRVYYAKSENKSGGDYLMDHSSIIYLMDKEGTFLRHFSYGTDATALAKAIEEAIDG